MPGVVEFAKRVEVDNAPLTQTWVTVMKKPDDPKIASIYRTYSVKQANDPERPR